MKPLLSKLGAFHARCVICGENLLPVYNNFTFIGRLEKIQTAKERCFSASGGAYDAQHLPLFQREIHTAQNLRIVEIFFQALYFKKCHFLLHHIL